MNGVHLNLRPHNCEVCSNSFKSVPNLIRHLKTHNQANIDTLQELPSPQSSHQSEKAANTRQSFLSDDEEPPAMIARRRSLLSHKMSKHSGAEFRCHICNQQFAREDSVRRHVRFNHRKDETFKCKVCSRLFCDNYSLKRHITDIHLKERNHKCDKCDKTYTRKGHLLNHYCREHVRTPQPLSCDFCSQTFTDDMTKATHIVEEHGDQVFNTEISAEESARQNPASASKFKEKDLSNACIQNKESATSAPYQCGICRMAFSSPQDLKDHVDMIHMNSKNNKETSFDQETISACNDESVTFVTKQDPKLSLFPRVLLPKLEIIELNPVRKELATKSFSCDKCGTSFSTKTKLKLHVVRRHLIRPFNSKTHHQVSRKESSLVCDRCGKGFSSKQAMEVHIRTVHLGERAFKCDLCDKRFTQRTSLRHHINVTHLGLKQPKKYKCHQCDKSFTQTQSRKVHIDAVHLGLKPYNCDICDAKFGQSYNLLGHLRKTHKIFKPHKCGETRFTKKIALLGHKRQFHDHAKAAFINVKKEVLN